MVSELNLPITLDNRYLVLEQIDSGGTSKIYKATDTRLEREVAVKILSSNVDESDVFAQRFKAEAQSVAKLNHPNIVSVYDWGVHDSRPFIVMEYVKGETLKKYLQKNSPIPFEEIVQIMNEICAAILTAHDEGIIHRDIKPGNILVTGNKQIKVADFGIAKSIHNPEHTEVGKVLGTASYFSPEQAVGEKATERSDVYSLGIVLFELITGRVPFREESSVATALAHVKKPVPDVRTLRPDTPLALVNIVTQALKKEPSERYENVNELRKDLIIASRTMHSEEATAIIAPIGDYSGDDKTALMDQTPQDSEEDDYDDDEDDTGSYDLNSNKTSRIALIVLAVIVGIGIIAMIIFTALSAGGGEDKGPAEVPRVVGLQYNVAREKIETAGFKVKRELVVNPEVPEGEVFEQDPAPGTNLRRDNFVLIKVSAGLGTTEMPDVVGKSKVEAQRIIEDEGLNVSFREETSEDIKEDTVIKTSPKAGKKIKRGNEVIITTSSGSEGVIVPNVNGKDESTAANQLGQLEFATKTIKENSSTVAAGKVIKTDPAADAKVKRGATVTMYVSSGPEEDTVPQVVGFSTSKAVNLLQQAGFSVNVVNIESSSSQKDKVLSQSPEGGATSTKGTQVTIFVGSGPSAPPAT